MDLPPIYHLLFSKDVEAAPKITFARLWRALGEEPGVFDRITVSRLARLCETTEGALRYHLKALKASGIVDYVGRGEITLYVYHPIPSERRRRPDPPTPLFDALEDSEATPAEFSKTACVTPGSAADENSENPSENFSEIPKNLPRENQSGLPAFETPSHITRARADQEEININYSSSFLKKERKEEEFSLKDSKREPAGRKDAPGSDSRPSAGDVRRRVAFDEPGAAELRDSILREIWEWGMSSDLIDRIAAEVVLKIPGFDREELSRLFRRARQKGLEKLWMAINPEIRTRYLAAGWIYPKCDAAPEPCPTPRQRAPTRPAAIALPREETTIDRLIESTRGLPDTVGETLEATTRKVFEMKGRRGSMMDARGEALVIRMAWKEIRKKERETVG